MLDKMRELLSLWWSGKPNGEQHELIKLFSELQELILKNQVKLVDNEGLITKVEVASLEEKKKVRGASSAFEKRAALRRVRSAKKRIECLNRCSRIYRDNIHMQSSLSERLEDMRVQGMKTVSTELLEEMTLDYEEMYNKHKELVDSVKAMGTDYVAPENFEDDPELYKLAKEHGLI